jgi:hypothetical protein
MKIKTLPLSSADLNKSKHIFNIMGDLKVTVEIVRNPLGLSVEALFQMAARINKKRSFLFVSKVLGKHIPVNPYVSLLGGAALAVLLQQANQEPITVELEEIVQAFENPSSLQAREIYSNLKAHPLEINQAHLFIGFAETATALGHSMYDVFSGPTRYLHTTREQITDLDSVINFEEEHSHATAHRCYALQNDFFIGTQPIVLVDDEVTTGNTALNIIRDLQHKFPRSKYIIASLLDWRSDADRAKFAALEQEFGIEINCLSLIEGQITVEGAPIEAVEAGDPEHISTLPRRSTFTKHNLHESFDHLDVSSENVPGCANGSPYLRLTGRFGIECSDNSVLNTQILQAANYLKSHRTGQNTLCMGTGEFMYLPMRIAAEMGAGIRYQSTTRSPIHPGDEADYAVRSRLSYSSPDDPSVGNFLYNIHAGLYDELFVFMEREAADEAFRSFREALYLTGIPHIHLVYFNLPA